MRKQTPKQAVVYARISKDDGTALGVGRQESDCLAWCEAQGWQVAEVLVENDTSAYSRGKRPLYARLLDGVAQGTYDGIVAWHPDRLHRHPAELEEFIALVEERKVPVSTVTAGDYDLSTPEGRLMARITGSVARKESEDKSRRLRRKHEELAAQGKVSGGGRRPFGYEADKVTIRESEAREIRSAVARVLAGESLRSVTLDWRDRVPSVTGAPWSPTTVKRLLTSARIAGQREHNGALTPAVWPAIVELDSALKVRSVLGTPATKGKVTPRKYLLTGLLHCGRCDAALTSAPVRRKGNLYGRYACPVDRGGCGRCGIAQAPLDELISEAVLVAAANVTQEATEPDNDLSVVSDIERRMSDLAEMFAAGEISRGEWATARTALDARLSDATDALAQSEIRASMPSGSDLRSSWGEWPLERRRAVVEQLVERIVIAPTTRTNNKFDPARVSITWRA